jgi:succinate dehydrogenase flavin-adding protein (antitoxin of CptAB toxin-antitoxin module)
MNYTKEEIINELGLQKLSEQAQDHVVVLVYHTFNMRTAMALSDKLTDQQLDEFNRLSQKNDDELAKWVQANVPDMKEVIEAEMQAVLAEIKQNGQSMTKSV